MRSTTYQSENSVYEVARTALTNINNPFAFINGKYLVVWKKMLIFALSKLINGNIATQPSNSFEL